MLKNSKSKFFEYLLGTTKKLFLLQLISLPQKAAADIQCLIILMVYVSLHASFAMPVTYVTKTFETLANHHQYLKNFNILT